MRWRSSTMMSLMPSKTSSPTPTTFNLYCRSNLSMKILMAQIFTEPLLLLPPPKLPLCPTPLLLLTQQQTLRKTLKAKSTESHDQEATLGVAKRATPASALAPSGSFQMMLLTPLTPLIWPLEDTVKLMSMAKYRAAQPPWVTLLQELPNSAFVNLKD